MLGAADRLWAGLGKGDRLEAFDHHPRIGEKQLREKFGATAQWAGQEQAGVKTATNDMLTALEVGNREYERKFGHIFLVCAILGTTISPYLFFWQTWFQYIAILMG